MLRREGVGQRRRLGQVGGDDDAPLTGQRRGDDVVAAERLHLPGHFALHRLGQRARGRQQDGRGQRVVLGLGQQVGRHPGRVGRLVGDDHRLRRPGQPVDADQPEHLPLGQGHEEIARPDDLIHPWNRRRAKGQGGHGLRPAQRIDCRQADGLGRGQNHRRHAAVAPRRGDDDDLGHARHLSRDGRHEQRRRQRRAAAGHVDAHPPQRRHPLAEATAERRRRPRLHGL